MNKRIKAAKEKLQAFLCFWQGCLLLRRILALQAVSGRKCLHIYWGWELFWFRLPYYLRHLPAGFFRAFQYFAPRGCVCFAAYMLFRPCTSSFYSCRAELDLYSFPEGGGFIGGIILWTLRKIAGTAGALIILVVLGLASVLLLSRISLQLLFVKIKKFLFRHQ